MNGQIFISYRRDDASYPAGRLYDRLAAHFPKNQIFMDVDNLDPAADFLEAITTSVGSCDVLIAVIGKRWLVASDEEGRRRLDNPDDLVRLEIATALKRNIRVIPLLVDGAMMPRSTDLPDDLKLMVWRNALDVSHTRFNADLERLRAALATVLEKAEVERKQREAKARQEAEQQEKERLEAELREKERLEAKQRRSERLKSKRTGKKPLDVGNRKGREKERPEAGTREREQPKAEEHAKERLEVERQVQKRLETEKQAKQHLEAERRVQERLEAERREREERQGFNVVSQEKEEKQSVAKRDLPDGRWGFLTSR